MKTRSTEVRSTVVCAVLLVLFSSVACEVIEGNGQYGEEQRSLESFEAVEVSGEFRVGVLVTDKVDAEGTTVTVTGDDNLLEHVRTRVKDNKLIIHERGGVWLDPELPLTVEVITPSLGRVEASGDNNVQVEGLKGQRFKVGVSGDAQVLVKGEVDRFVVDISGDASVRARELVSQSARVNVSGDAEVRLCAEEALDVNISGCADVYYYCEPQTVDRNISGDAKIKRR